jgi:hypothetical protein
MRYLHALTAFGVVISSLSILVVAWLTVWFQIAGSVANRGDYAVASGLYDVGIVLMILGAAAVVLAHGPRWVLWWCAFALLFLVVATLRAHLRVFDNELPSALGSDTWWSGVWMALRMPWNWLVPIALVIAVLRRPAVSARRDAPSRPRS